jgi:hypothetical protein
MLEKIRELLWPTLQPFTQIGELCLICCSPFRPKSAWILGTCQYMYHLQCLITLMVPGGKVNNVGPHFISAYTNNSVFKWPCHNIGSIISFTHPIGHKHGVQTWNGFGMLAHLLLHGESIQQMAIWQRMWIIVHVNDRYMTPLILSNALGVV